MTVSIPLPAVRMAEPDILPQPFRLIDEVFCEIVLRAMAEIAEREEHQREQEAVRPRQEVQHSLRDAVEGVVASVSRCPDSTPLLGCCDGTIRLPGPVNCSHSLDCAPIVCCCSAEVDSGAVLVAACTTETLHLRLLDQAEPSRVLQEHQCHLNTTLPHRGDSYMQFSPCSRHILVADGFSLSTYSIADLPIAVQQPESHSAQHNAHDGFKIQRFQLSMTFHGPDDSSVDGISLPVAYWRSQPPTKHSFSSSEAAAHTTVGLVFHWPDYGHFHSHSFCPPATPVPASPKASESQPEADVAGVTGKAGKDTKGATKAEKSGKPEKGKGGKDSGKTSTTEIDPAADATDSVLPPTVLRNVDTSALGTTRTLPLPAPATRSCMAHDGASIAFALSNGCMMVICCRSLAMTAVSPVLRNAVQSLAFSADDGAVLFVEGSGVLGVWRHQDFHERVYGGGTNNADAEGGSAVLKSVRLLSSHPLRLRAVLHASPVGVLVQTQDGHLCVAQVDSAVGPAHSHSQHVTSGITLNAQFPEMSGSRPTKQPSGCGYRAVGSNICKRASSEEGTTFTHCSLEGKQYNVLHVEAPVQETAHMESAVVPAASDGTAAPDSAAASTPVPAPAEAGGKDVDNVSTGGEEAAVVAPVSTLSLFAFPSISGVCLD